LFVLSNNAQPAPILVGGFYFEMAMQLLTSASLHQNICIGTNIPFYKQEKARRAFAERAIELVSVYFPTADAGSSASLRYIAALAYSRSLA
jgi:hypothetical protein